MAKQHHSSAAVSLWKEEEDDRCAARPKDRSLLIKICNVMWYRASGLMGLRCVSRCIPINSCPRWAYRRRRRILQIYVNCWTSLFLFLRSTTPSVLNRHWLAPWPTDWLTASVGDSIFGTAIPLWWWSRWWCANWRRRQRNVSVNYYYTLQHGNDFN